MITIHELLKKMIDMRASDLHLTNNSPPLFRVDGRLVPMSPERLGSNEVGAMAYQVMNVEQKKSLEQNKEVDFSFSTQNARFRANVFFQRACYTAVFRQIPLLIKSIDELGMPPVVKKLTERPNGLVLVTGPTGSGKSTTLAAMVDKINNELEGHILTVEDPIEFVHNNKKCIVNQREVKQDTNTFASALRVALRQDPDVVLVGEMRDLETTQAALSIAETGHLTLATLHTNSAAQTINRIIDIFPADMKATVRTQLSMVLEGVISQALIPRVGGGRVMACEIMIATPAIRSLIRDDKVPQIPSYMEAGQQFGMQTMNNQLAILYNKRLITKKDAFGRSPEPDGLKKLIGEP